VLHHVARQVFRQRFAFGFAPTGLDFRLDRGRLGFRLRVRWRGLGVFFLEIANHQLQLIDLTPEFLR
jgi:hypothetical protein